MRVGAPALRPATSSRRLGTPPPTQYWSEVANLRTSEVIDMLTMPLVEHEPAARAGLSIAGGDVSDAVVAAAAMLTPCTKRLRVDLGGAMADMEVTRAGVGPIQTPFGRFW